MSWAPSHLVIFTFSRWPGGPRVLVGRGSPTLLLLVRPFSSRFTLALLQLFCDFDSDGTCLTGVRACHLRFVCSLSLLCKYYCRPPFNQTLRTLWPAIPLDRIIERYNATPFCLKRDCGIDQAPGYIDIDLDQKPLE